CDRGAGFTDLRCSSQAYLDCERTNSVAAWAVGRGEVSIDIGENQAKSGILESSGVGSDARPK
ncbi:MAG TPA: hypothetical protein VF493_16365, partial [Terriglobales bacterium]